MNKRWMYLAALVSFACADTAEVLSPAGARFNTSSTTQLNITANTYGPGGSLWFKTGEHEVCSSTFTQIVWGTVQHTVEWQIKCGPSTFSAPSSEEYVGGWVGLSVQTDAGYEGVGNGLEANFSQDGILVEIPAGAGIHLQANVYSGCEFNRWDTNLGTFYDRDQYLPAGVTYVRSWFACMGGGGTGGPGGGM